MLFRFWVIVTGLWELWVGVLGLGVYHFHNPRDIKALVILALIPFAFLALGYACKWAFTGGTHDA